MKVRKIFLHFFVTLLITACAFVGVGELLIHPAHQTIGAPPKELNAQAVKLKTRNNGWVAGWFVAGKPGAGAVLLLHGVRGNRYAMVARAKFLHAAGYCALLIDLPAHGESSGDHITFGLHEADGVTAALAYLRDKLPQEKIGVIGVSLGAAALVFSQPATPPHAVILESMYPTIAQATENRLSMRLGYPGKLIAPLFYKQLPWRLGIKTEQLQPITKINNLYAPILIASGTEDQHTTVAETKQINDTANQPKQLWLVDGAAHVDLHAYNPKIYEEKILAFLTKYMSGGS